jgi:HEAT repeat protein
MNISAAFRALIGISIPQIVNLLIDDDWDVRAAAAQALLKFSEQGM